MKNEKGSYIKIFSLVIVFIYAMYYYFTRGYIANLKDFLILGGNGLSPITASEFSAISSAFSLVYGLCQPLGGFIMDKVGLKYLCPTLLAIGCGAIYVFSNYHDPAVAIYSRYVLGACMCVASTGSLKYLSVVWNKHYILLSNSCSILLCIAAAIASSSPIRQMMVYFGWRNFLKGFAAVGFVISILLLISFMGVFKKTKEEKIEKEEEKEQSVSLLTSLKEIVSLQGFFPITIFCIAISAAAYILMEGWGNTLLGMRFPELTANALTYPATFNMIGNAFGAIFNILARKLNIKVQMYVYASVGLASLGAILFIESSFYVFLGCCFLLGFTCAAQAIGFLYLQQNLSKKYLGLGFGILNFSCMFFGCALVQKVAGYILDFFKNSAIKGGLAWYEGYRYIDLMNMFKLLFIPGVIALIATIIFRFKKKEHNI